MSAEDNTNKELVTVFKEFIDHSKGQNKELYKRMDELASGQKETSKQVQYLAKAIEKTTVQHDKLSDDVSRIEENTKQTGVKLSNYMENNDNRVMDVEKQVLLLGASEDSIRSRIDKKDKIWASVVSAVIVAGILVFLGLK